jgi:hypothetical protein
MAPTVGTAERDQPFMVAGTALYAQKPMRQSATFEVLIEFLLYVVGQRPSLFRHVSTKLQVVPVNIAIEAFFSGRCRS